MTAGHHSECRHEYLTKQRWQYSGSTTAAPTGGGRGVFVGLGDGVRWRWRRNHHRRRRRCGGGGDRRIERRRGEAFCGGF
ncbi:hypothetical protein Hanom_Chr04g00329491 [Helianthus anomalus]